MAADRRFAAELTLSAARQAAPYCHARKVIIEEETVPTVNVVDRRETGRLITNGHGSNGHGGNGSNGSNGHGGNGHGDRARRAGHSRRTCRGGGCEWERTWRVECLLAIRSRMGGKDQRGGLELMSFAMRWWTRSASIRRAVVACSVALNRQD